MKKMSTKKSRSFIKLKGAENKNISIDIDDAVYLARAKDGSVLGHFSVDFDLSKKKSSIQFKRFRAKK